MIYPECFSLCVIWFPFQSKGLHFLFTCFFFPVPKTKDFLCLFILHTKSAYIFYLIMKREVFHNLCVTQGVFLFVSKFCCTYRYNRLISSTYGGHINYFIVMMFRTMQWCSHITNQQKNKGFLMEIKRSWIYCIYLQREKKIHLFYSCHISM